MDGPTQVDKSKLEITDDPTTLRVIISEMCNALNGPAGRCSSRERSLAVTKLQEASMWLNEALRVE